MEHLSDMHSTNGLKRWFTTSVFLPEIIHTVTEERNIIAKSSRKFLHIQQMGRLSIPPPKPEDHHGSPTGNLFPKPLITFERDQFRMFSSSCELGLSNRCMGQLADQFILGRRLRSGPNTGTGSVRAPFWSIWKFVWFRVLLSFAGSSAHSTALAGSVGIRQCKHLPG